MFHVPDRQRPQGNLPQEWAWGLGAASREDDALCRCHVEQMDDTRGCWWLREPSRAVLQDKGTV